MDFNQVIADFEKLDKESQINRSELLSSFREHLWLLVVVLVGVALYAWLIVESIAFVLGMISVVLLLFYLFFAKKEETKQARLFALRHNLFWHKRTRIPRHLFSGAVFGVGHSARSFNHFNSDLFGVFLYQFTTGHGRSAQNHAYTVAYFDLPKELPHILLDSKKNDRLLASSIPRFLDKKYKVSLEGDFDKHFTLYTAFPKPAEALAILSPDVMHTLINEAPLADIEVVNRRLWVYIPKKTGFTDYATALKAGFAVLKSADRNLVHYKMDDLVALISQDNSRQKLYKNRLALASAVLIIYFIYLVLMFTVF